MANVLTEVGIEYVKTRWRRKFGNEPDVNSPEFKAFQKQVNKDYNQKTQQKAASDDFEVGKYYDALIKIVTEKPQAFPEEFYNALTNFSKKGKIELCNMLVGKDSNLSDENKVWVNVIGHLFNTNKSEAAEVTLQAMKESSKYPWISGLINHRLMKEDDFNLDNFDASVAGAGGMDISSDSSSTDTTNTDNGTDDFNLDDIDSSDVADGDSDLHIEPAGGGLDSISGGMGDDMGDEEAPQAAPDKPTYRIIGMVFDPKDPDNPPKVKVQNMETGETEMKDLCEIDA